MKVEFELCDVNSILVLCISEKRDKILKDKVSVTQQEIYQLTLFDCIKEGFDLFHHLCVLLLV